jgi:hypothetical protein
LRPGQLVDFELSVGWTSNATAAPLYEIDDLFTRDSRAIADTNIHHQCGKPTESKRRQRS